MFTFSNALQGRRLALRASRATSRRPLGNRLTLEALEERQLLTAVPVGPEFTVSAVTAGSLAAPQMAHDQAGNFIVVWEDTGGDGDGYGIFAQRYAADGTAEGGRVTVNTVTAGNQRAPSVAMNDSGQYVISWQNDDIFAQRFNADGSRDGGEFTVNTTTAGVQSQPSVGIDAAGDFAVAWRGATPTQLVVRQFDADGQGHDEFSITPSPTVSDVAPKLAMNSSGQFAVSWTARVGTRNTAADESDVFINRYYADGSLVGDTINSSLIGQSNPVFSTALAIDDDGSLTFMHSQSIGATNPNAAASILARFSSTGVPIGKTDTSGIFDVLYGNGALAVDSAGNAVRSGIYFNNSYLQFVEYSADSKKLWEQSIYEPAVATGIVLADSGRITVTWNTGSEIHAQQFQNATPLAVGGVTTTTGEFLSGGSVARIPLEQLKVNFTGPVSTDGGGTGPHSVTNPANWQLLKDGVDASSLISSITYQRNQATIHFNSLLGAGNYQLIALDVIQSADGTALDGDANRQPGGNFATTFAVSTLVLGGPTRVVSTEAGPIAGGQTSDGVAVDSDAAGNYVVVWSTVPSDDPFYHIKAQRYSAAGQAVGSEIVVDQNLDASPTTLKVALDGHGGFTVAWIGNLSTGYARRFDASGAAVGDSLNFGALRPLSIDVATDLDGNFVVAWATSSGNGSNAQYCRFDAGAHALGGVVTLDTAGRIAVAMNAQGYFAIAWQGAGMFSQAFSPQGNPLGGVANTVDFSNQLMDIGIDDVGHYAIAWSHQSPRARVFNWDGTPVTDTLTPAPNVSFLYKVTINMSAQGDFQLIWDGDLVPLVTKAIKSAHYSPQGVLLGSPLNVLVLVSGQSPYTFATTAGASGDDIVVWRRNQPGQSPVLAQQVITDHAPVVDLNGNPPGVDYAGVLVPGSGPVPIVDPDQLFVSNPLEGTLQSVEVSIASPLAGDLLAADTSGTAIVASFAAGVLTLSGTDSVEHYQQVLRTLTFAADPSRTTGDVVDISVLAHDGTLDSQLAHSLISIYTPGSASVADRHVFYNNSSFDGGDAGANGQDDAAIATDKAALLPGQAATLANYTSFSSGLNGLMIDLAGTHGAVSLDDFTFKLGNNNDPNSWVSAPAPTLITVRAGAGVSGSDRVELIWDAGIRNQWLQVTLAANAHTGLAQPDVFYFGNAAGDSGNSATDARVNVTDQLAARYHATGSAAITNPYDYNRDGHVDSSDELWARNHPTNLGNALRLISVPGPIVVASSVALTAPGASPDPAAAIVLSTVGRIDATSQAVTRLQLEPATSAPTRLTPSAVAAALTSAEAPRHTSITDPDTSDTFEPDTDWLDGLVSA